MKSIKHLLGFKTSHEISLNEKAEENKDVIFGSQVFLFVYDWYSLKCITLCQPKSIRLNPSS